MIILQILRRPRYLGKIVVLFRIEQRAYHLSPSGLSEAQILNYRGHLFPFVKRAAQGIAQNYLKKHQDLCQKT